MDAISYVGLGHVFTAMLTGNTVLLGLAIGQGHVIGFCADVVVTMATARLRRVRARS